MADGEKMTSEDRYDSLFQYYGWLSGVDWLLLKAQARVESNFGPDAKSPTGAMGLAQFMPATFDEWSQKLKIPYANPRNPEHSIRCQAAYLCWLLDQFNRDLLAALAAYNWGLSHVKATVAAMGEAWKAELPEETQNYLARVETHYQRYRKEQEDAARPA